MSKPSIPGELRNVDVKFVSLVDKAANRRKFKIFKSADWPEEEPAVHGSAGQPDPEQKEFRSFFGVIKEFFTGARKAQEDSLSFARTMAALETEDALWRAFSTLRDVCTNILSSDVEDKAARITQVIDEFRAYLLGKIGQLGVTKALEQIRTGAEVEKVGRKISAARLKALKDAHAILAQIIAEAEADISNEEEGFTVTKEELTSLVSKAVEEATKPINERLEKLEKEAGKDEVSKEDIQAIIQEAVAKAVKPLEERLEVVEKVRGISNKIPEGKDPIEKSDFWGGVFLG